MSDGRSGPGQRRSRRWRLGAAVAMILIGVAPMASVLIAGQIAEAAGCALHEGFVQPCLIAGRDMGGILYTMTTLGWLMLVSLLFLASGLLTLLIEGLRALLARMLR